MDRPWKLGDDLSKVDNLLDGLTFADLILVVCCNSRIITPTAVQKELQEMLESRMQDMRVLLAKNMNEIIREAKKGRS